MLYRVRRRSADEGGLTLIELLMAVLIIGILAAIAIPSFLNQKGKAIDATAKSQARTLQTATETIALDYEGSYEGLSLANLESIEVTLKDHNVATPSMPKTAWNEYEVASEAKSTKHAFKILRKPNGEVERTCTVKGEGGCPKSGKW